MMVSVNTWMRNWKNIVSIDYIRDRMDINFVSSVIRQSIFEKKHPMYPWITIDMIKILENLLTQNDVGFEFGSGNSTVWFAKNTKKIYSVEHSLEWFETVKMMLKNNRLLAKSDVSLVGESDYVKPIFKIKNKTLDYCFVDGIFRDECILRSIPKLKSGGVLIVDNVDNYFPKNKISISVRYKRDNFSKTVSMAKMKKIYDILSKWRCIWTSSGIQDTALWIKP